MSKINETNYPRRTQASYEDTDMLVIQKSGGNTYTTRIEDLREDCQETLAPALNTMRENLATVEGSTASKAYAKGDFLVFGGRLCKAKTSIAVNATLVLDTNIELASVGGELSSISSDLASFDTDTIGTLNVYKNGKEVSIYGKVESLDASLTTIVYATLASKFIPKTNYTIGLLLSTTLPYTPIGTVWISSYGQLVIYKGSETQGYIYMNYMCQ